MMVVDHYEDKVSHVDLGNGYFEEKTERAPVYKEESQYMIRNIITR